MSLSPNAFRKNRPASSHNLIGISTRTKKTSRRQKASPSKPCQKPLKPSSTPITFGPASTGSSSTGFYYMLAVFVIGFVFVQLIIYFTS